MLTEMALASSANEGKPSQAELSQEETRQAGGFMQVLVWADQQSSLTCTIIIVIINRQRHCHQAMDAKSALLCMRPYHQSPTLAILHKTNLLCNLGPYRGYPYMTSPLFSYFLIPTSLPPLRHHFLYLCVITFI